MSVQTNPMISRMVANVSVWIIAPTFVILSRPRGVSLDGDRKSCRTGAPFTALAECCSRLTHYLVKEPFRGDSEKMHTVRSYTSSIERNRPPVWVMLLLLHYDL